MPADALRSTCMDLKNQKAVKITTNDVTKSIQQLAYWHSKNEKCRNLRRDFMMNYIPDIQEIST
jgi:tRNA(Ile)-lysidine synthase TilS/MesJ